MPGSEAFSQLPLLGASPASDDFLPMVDVSDTTQASTGTTKRITIASLFDAPSFTGEANFESIATTEGVNVGGALEASGVVSSGGLTTSASTGPGLGYATGAGATVAQASSASTAVTINALCGTITMQAVSLGPSAFVRFTVNNSEVREGDIVHVAIKSSNTAGSPNNTMFGVLGRDAVDGSFVIQVVNNTGVNASTVNLVLSFAVLRAVSV